MKLVQIPADLTEQVWGAVEPFIERACALSNGTNTPQSAKERAANGMAQLWAIVEDAAPHRIVAAGLTSLMDYHTGKRALHAELLGGDDMKLWFDLKPQIEQWAKQNGCDLFFCWARKGWIRMLPDMRVTHYMLMKEL